MANRMAIAYFNSTDHYPWFGEMALVNNKRRGAAAVALEPSKLLTLDRSQFGNFLQVMPSFVAMFATNQAAYTNLNKMSDEDRDRRERELARRVAKEAREAARSDESFNIARITSTSALEMFEDAMVEDAPVRTNTRYSIHVK